MLQEHCLWPTQLCDFMLMFVLLVITALYSSCAFACVFRGMLNRRNSMRIDV